MPIRLVRSPPAETTDPDPDASAAKRQHPVFWLMLNRNFIFMLAGLLLGSLVLTLQPTPAVGEEQAAVTESASTPPDANRYTEAERLRLTILAITAAVLVVTVLAMLFLLVRRLRAERQVASADEPQAFLNDRSGITSQPTHKLSRKPTMIGRGTDNEPGCLAFIVIPDKTIGRRHALIEYKQFSFWISDQGSSNGTYVNDRRVTTEMRLKNGDCIRLHKFEFEFIEPAEHDDGATAV